MHKSFFCSRKMIVLGISALLTLGSFCAVANDSFWRDSVVGSGTVDIVLMSGAEPVGMPQGNLTVAAHSEADGESPFGTIRVRSPGFTESTVKVDCLMVAGNRAVAGGRLESNVYLYLVIEDLGNKEDRATAVLLFGPDEPWCDFIYFLSFEIPIFPPRDVEHGNYTVRDAP